MATTTKKLTKAQQEVELMEVWVMTLKLKQVSGPNKGKRIRQMAFNQTAGHDKKMCIERFESTGRNYKEWMKKPEKALAMKMVVGPPGRE